MTCPFHSEWKVTDLKEGIQQDRGSGPGKKSQFVPWTDDMAFSEVVPIHDFTGGDIEAAGNVPKGISRLDLVNDFLRRLSGL